VRLLAKSEQTAAVPELKRNARERRQEAVPESLSSAVGKTAVAGTAIVVAGYVLSKTAEALADQTGLPLFLHLCCGAATKCQLWSCQNSIRANFTLPIHERHFTPLRAGR
jgi:hypothetical protein